MKLGNKGFAITGILYTIFVLFLMILLSVLGGLNIKRKLLEKNIDNMKECLEEKCYEIENNNDIPYTTKYSGKYIIEVNGTTYQTYLSKGKELTSTTLNDLSYIGFDTSYTRTINFAGAKIVKICTTETVS